MRQNPIISSRVQVGGRPMPSWFSASLIKQARSTPPPPPLPTEPPPADESDYEEIDHLHSYTNMNMKKSTGAKRSCSLCGNPNPVVRCEMCNNQIFCGSCNDMYHRHPKRHNHIRKLLESLDNRPPLPPKSFSPEIPPFSNMTSAKSFVELPTHSPTRLPPTQQLPGMMPVPPPRRHKRFGMRSATGSPTITRKVLFGMDPMGSLKRFVGMGQRPLPPPPKPAGPPLPPKNDLTRPMTPTPVGIRGSNNTTMVDRRHSSPMPPSVSHRTTSSNVRNIPLTVLEMQNSRNQSISVANLSDKHPSSHDSGYRDWEDEDDFFLRQRASSVSTSNLGRYPASSSNASHFATLQRPGRNHNIQNAPQRPPPPVPPRHFSSQLSFQSSQSVFDLDRMSASQNFAAPWNYPGSGYPYELQQTQAHQQAAMMGYPGTMRKTPSNSSMRGEDRHGRGQPFFGWGPMGMGQPMTQNEMEREIMAARRGSEPPPYGNQESMSQPVTPQGSFRKKSARPSSSDRVQGFERMRNQNQQLLQHPRPPTPNFGRNTHASNTSISKKHLESEEDSYFSADKKELAGESDSFDESKVEKTVEPEGPWSCEHCTFVNPKSTKVCTVCCKTPVDGYINVLAGKNRIRRSGSRIKDSSKEDAPVVKSKLSFSRTTEKQHVINLSVEQVKKRPPTPQRPQSFRNESDEDANDENENKNNPSQHRKLQAARQKGQKSFINSNEDVYGSVPLQTLTISPKIDIRKPSKISTAVGSSPPKFEDTGVGGSPPPAPSPPFETKSNKVKPSQSESRNPKAYNEEGNDETISSSVTVGITANKSNIITPSKLKVLSTTSTTSTSTSTSSQGIQTSASSSSGSSNGNSSASYSTSSSASPFLGRKDLDAEKMRSTKGTSPPPQSISTQTYEEIPATKMRQKSSSKQSILSLQSEDSEPLQKPIEMSEKALRYARKAQHQHQSKLKRSMSTHLTSSNNDPWVDSSDSRHLYRSSSRHSLASDTRSLPLSGPPSREPSPPSRGGRFYEDFRKFPPPSWDRFPPSPGDYFASIEDLVTRKRRESMRSQEFELTRLLKEAEEFSYTPEDVQVALRMCGERNPIKWLQENWSNMIETVQTLATKYGREKGQESNEVGTISSAEAKEALRVHRGNVWAAVTECVEQRRKKFMELQSRGTFLREDVLTALTANHGNLDAAYVELSKAQLKPFLMKIWGPPSGLDNDDPNLINLPSPSVKSLDLEPFLPSAPIMSLLEKMKPYTDSQSNQHETKPFFGSTFSDQSNELPSTESPEDEEVEVSDSQEDSSSEEEEDDLESDDEDELKIEIEELDEDLTEDLEPEPRLERLVCDAERVTMEIEKAIQELKCSAGESLLAIKSGQNNTINANATAIQAKLETLLPILSDTPVELQTTMEQSHPEKNTEGESETRKMSMDSVQLVKSDEDESFVDAISDGDAMKQTRENTVSPGSDLEQKVESAIIDIDAEVDESEALVSEFIQNFEIAPPKPPKPVEEIPTKMPEDEESKLGVNQEASTGGEKDSINIRRKSTEGSPKRVLSSSEIEQILSSLVTSNFNSMGQFAADIKEKIATEIQTQLAAATANATAIVAPKQSEENASNESSATTIQLTVATSESDEDDIDKAYEPITLPQAVYDNVNKKMAKYERVAAKKKQKVLRRKSPENSATSKTSSSGSPSPSTSLSHLAVSKSMVNEEQTIQVNDAQNLELDQNFAINSAIVSVAAEIDESTGEKLENDDALAITEEEGFSVYEEVEMGKSESLTGSEEEIEEEQEENPIENEQEGESDIEAEDVSEDGGDRAFNEVNEIYEEVEMSLANFKASTEPLTTVVETTASISPISENKGNTNSDTDVLVEAELALPISETEAHIQRLIGEGHSINYERAELAVQLMEMDFNEEDSVYAANECSSLYAALSWLQQECDLCTGKFSARQMVSMLRCTHFSCRSCAKEYFQVQVRDKPIIDATCPFCKEPSTLTEDAELATEYFNHLDILLKNLLDNHHHEMFQRKLRDWTLAKTPNFKWCSKCSSGFITEPLQTRLVCPDCSAVTCAICLEPWEKNHDHRDSTVVLCDAGEASKSIADYLNENCIECPRCHFKFALARGGCMHLTCTQCRHEFCSGCSAPFRMGTKCEAKFLYCEKLGLHAHHPRNCLFYLRDKEPDSLVKLLEEHSIPYLKEAKEAEIPKKRRLCKVPIQREVESSLVDGFCDKTAPFGCAKVCLPHYVEYLGLLIWQNHLDPISILKNEDLETIIRRADKKLPGRIPFGISDADYRPLLLKVIADDVPL